MYVFKNSIHKVIAYTKINRFILLVCLISNVNFWYLSSVAESKELYDERIGIITSIAGSDIGDGRKAVDAFLWNPTSLKVDHKGNIFSNYLGIG